MLTRILIELVGWTGALSLLAAYALVSTGRVESRSASYQMLNAVGAFGFVVNGWYHGAFPSVMLNTIWFAIAVAVLVRRRPAG